MCHITERYMGVKRLFGDRIQRRVELLGGRGRKDGLGAGPDQRGVEQELESVIETVLWQPSRIIRFSNVEGIGQGIQLVWQPCRISRSSNEL